MLELHLIGGALFLAMFMRFSVARCCCVALGEECGSCDTDTTPAQYTLEFSGVANNICLECGDYNTATLVLPQTGGLTPCNYQQSIIPCSGLAVVAFRRESAPTLVGRCQVFKSGALLESHGTVGITDPEDCRRSYTIAMTTLAFGDQCDWNAATAVIDV